MPSLFLPRFFPSFFSSICNHHLYLKRCQQKLHQRYIVAGAELYVSDMNGRKHVKSYTVSQLERAQGIFPSSSSYIIIIYKKIHSRFPFRIKVDEHHFSSCWIIQRIIVFSPNLYVYISNIL